MTIYCYDTEFLEDGNTIELISIGIVGEDGREYYAVNSEAPIDRIKVPGPGHEWMIRNVLPHLPVDNRPILDDYLAHAENRYPKPSITLVDLDRTSPLVKPKWVIANEVREFLLDDYVPAGTAGITDANTPIGRPPELWAYYAAYDHVVLAQLWGRMAALPSGIPMYTHDLKQEMDRLGLTSKAVPKPANAHDALADARWNLAMLTKLRQYDQPRKSGQ